MPSATKKRARRNKSERRSNCPLACALDVVGDKWTLLVVRDLLQGCKRYGDFLESPERYPTNILADRLKRLEAQGLIERELYSKHPPRAEYSLSTKGYTLVEILNALEAWGLKSFENTSIYHRPAPEAPATEEESAEDAAEPESVEAAETEPVPAPEPVVVEEPEPVVVEEPEPVADEVSEPEAEVEPVVEESAHEADPEPETADTEEVSMKNPLEEAEEPAAEIEEIAEPEPVIDEEPEEQEEPATPENIHPLPINRKEAPVQEAADAVDAGQAEQLSLWG